MIVKYRCRCRRSACQARQTIARHPDEYLRPRTCRVCGKGRLRVDTYRDSGREHAGTVCRCWGYSFPHRRGSGYCFHNPNLTPEMLQEREETGTWA